MPEEEKELSIEEMRSLVALSTLLPALLNKIESINKRVDTLVDSFTKKFSENVTAMEAYKRSVDDLIKKQADLDRIYGELSEIKKALSDKKEEPKKPEPVVVPTKKPASTPKQPKKDDTATKEKDEMLKIVDKILGDDGGRRTRTLTSVQVKKGFKVDDEKANKVLDWLTKNKMYDPKSHILTFPKK